MGGKGRQTMIKSEDCEKLKNEVRDLLLSHVKELEDATQVLGILELIKFHIESEVLVKK